VCTDAITSDVFLHVRRGGCVAGWTLNWCALYFRDGRVPRGHGRGRGGHAEHHLPASTAAEGDEGTRVEATGGERQAVRAGG